MEFILNTVGRLWGTPIVPVLRQYRQKNLKFKVIADFCLGQCSFAAKRHGGPGNSYKGKHSVGADLQFTGLVHYHHGETHGGMKAYMVLQR